MRYSKVSTKKRQPATRNTQQRILGVIDTLNDQFVEREDVLHGCFLAVLAMKHVFFLSNLPGVAKSLIVRIVCCAIKGANFFGKQFDMTTKPDEIYGPVKVSGYKNDRYERKLDGYLAWAHLAFLDEIWKSTSAVTAPLLSQMDESRLYRNGDTEFVTPLMSVFAASNELPQQDGSAAIYDRFLLRYVVGDIIEPANFKQMLHTKITGCPGVIPFNDLVAAQHQIRTEIEISDSIYDLLTSLRENLKKEGFRFSPRRWNESLCVLQANAWLSGRDVVDSEDLSVLQHILWNKPEDKPEISKQIFAISSPDDASAVEILDQATGMLTEALRERATNDERTLAGSDFNNKANELEDRLRKLKQTSRVKEVAQRIDSMREEVYQKCFHMRGKRGGPRT